jgi:hypothetical protein
VSRWPGPGPVVYHWPARHTTTTGWALPGGAGLVSATRQAAAGGGGGQLRSCTRAGWQRRRTSPRSSGSSQARCCSAVPYLASTSMLPAGGGGEGHASWALVVARQLLHAWRQGRPVPLRPPQTKSRAPPLQPSTRACRLPPASAEPKGAHRAWPPRAAHQGPGEAGDTAAAAPGRQAHHLNHLGGGRTCVGRRAVKALGGPDGAAHDLAQLRVLEVAQPGAKQHAPLGLVRAQGQQVLQLLGQVVRQPQVPQALLLGQLLQPLLQWVRRGGLKLEG